LYDKKSPKFSRQFGTFEQPITAALAEYTDAVSARAFPAPSNSFAMDPAELAKFRRVLSAAEDGDSHFTARAQRRARLHANGDVAARTSAFVNGSSAVNGASLLLRGAKAPTTVRTIAEWRRLQSSGVLPPHHDLGLVPTMGALHTGHLSLISRAQSENSRVAASLFVNPTQFAAHEDLDTYPRPWEADLAKLTKLGVDYVFAPNVEEMYPPERPTRLSPFIDLVEADLSTAEGSSRPGFFRGVATVVAKLLNIVQPRSVYFGQKDGMQCVVVKRLIEDLDFNVNLVVCPTVREADGLAMSSRNAYLSPAERKVAPAVYASLVALQEQYERGERGVAVLRDEASRVIATEPAMALDYLSLASAVDGHELGEDATLCGSKQPTLASIAVKLGTTRLIDNIMLK